ncbi:MAG: flippase-like domain-containing protein [Actinobacteria bacterium]|nr:MAG: flippase-like domain-containing protein [Actinomycetota bacterium]
MKNRIISFYRENKKLILLLVRIIISVSLIVFLVKTQFKDIRSALEIIKSVNKPLLILSLSTHIFGIWITAVRWNTLLGTQKVKLGTTTLTLTVLIGFFFNNFLPTSIGGDVFRTYDAAKKANIPIETSASIIIVERFSGIISASTYAIIALFLGFTAIGNRSFIIPVIIFFIICIIIAFLILNPSILRLNKLINKIKFLKKVKEKLANIYFTFLSFKKFKWVLVRVLIYSFLLQFAVILNYFLAAKSLGINLNLTAFIFIVPVVTIIAMVPISIGGIGIRENTLVFIITAMGVGSEQAAICALLIFLMLIFIGIIGGITYSVRPNYIKHSTTKKLSNSKS